MDQRLFRRGQQQSVFLVQLIQLRQREDRTVLAEIGAWQGDVREISIKNKGEPDRLPFVHGCEDKDKAPIFSLSPSGLSALSAYRGRWNGS